MLPEDDRVIETCRIVFKCCNVNFRSLNEYMCICWGGRVCNWIIYRIHGATIKVPILFYFLGGGYDFGYKFKFKNQNQSIASRTYNVY